MSELPDDLEQEGLSAAWLARVDAGEDLSFGPSDQSPFVFAGATAVVGVAAIVLGFVAGWALLALSLFGLLARPRGTGGQGAKQVTLTEEGVFGAVHGPDPNSGSERGITWNETNRVAIGSSGKFFKERWVLIGRGEDSIRIPTTRDKTDELVKLIHALVTRQRPEE